MKLVVGFITYGENTAKYLPYFLPSIFNQTEKDFAVWAVDNSEDKNNENKEYIKDKYPEIEIFKTDGNIGFGRAYNLMIDSALKAGVDYFLMLNPDMILEPNMISGLLTEIKKDDKISAVQPKILKWCFDKKISADNHWGKTDIVDSYGLYITKEHRFSDLQQGEKDEGLKIPGEIFGFTGAAVMLNLKALVDVAYQNNNKKEYFDELMFMYKEDCDLSYRLRLAGWKIIFAPQAVCHHHRTASPKGEKNWRIVLNRKYKSKQVKQWSFLNHWILIFKYLSLPLSSSVKIKTWWYQLKSVIFVLLFEQYLLKEFITIWKIRKEILVKRKALKIRVDLKEIEKFML